MTLFRAVSVGIAALIATAVVADEFTYLEDGNGTRAREWVMAQNERALAELEGDGRFRENYQIALNGEGASASADANGLLGSPGQMSMHGAWIYQEWADSAHPRGLWRRTSLQSYVRHKPEWQVLLDVDALSATEQQNWTFVQALISPNGRRCLLVLSLGGSHQLAWREFDLESRSFIVDGFQVPPSMSSSAGSVIAWKDDDTVILTAKFGADSVSDAGVPIVLKEWRRGQPLTRSKDVFKGRRDDTAVYVRSADTLDGNGNTRRIIHVARTDRANRTTWWRLGSSYQLEELLAPLTYPVLYRGQYIFILGEDWHTGGKTWRKGEVIAVSEDDMVRADPRVRSLFAPEKDTDISHMQMTRKGVLLFGSWLNYGRVWRADFERGAWTTTLIPLPEHGRLLPGAADSHSDTAFVHYESFLDPPAIYQLDLNEREAKFFVGSDPQFDGEDFITEQLWARSADGTEVPYSLVRPRGLLFNGAAPTLVEAYGASGVTNFPMYLRSVGKLWLERGGVYVVANVRGGGERGPSWAVKGADRQGTYDDLVAVTEDLIRRKVTSAKRIGFMGYSAGGLLGGVMLTQRPDLFGAVVLKVPVLDQFRPDLLGRGRASAQEEYGSTEIPRELAFLQRTSPFQNLRPKAQLPRPLLITSTTDGRVFPAQVRRFAAKMESLGMPFLFHETEEGGHGLAVTLKQRAQLDALIYTYLARQLIDQSKPKQPFTVGDSINWTHVLPLVNGNGVNGNGVNGNGVNGNGRSIALFSPDRSSFVVHTRRGDLDRNVNVDSLLLFDSREVERYARSASAQEAPGPRTLLSMSAIRDEDVISNVGWINNQKMGLIARAPDGRMQAFEMDVASNTQSRLTASDTNVVAFASGGGSIAYYACVPSQKEQPLVVLVDSFEKALQAREPNDSGCFVTTPVQLFVATKDRVTTKVPLPAARLLPQSQRIWLDRTGDHAVILAPAVNAPDAWADYTGPDAEYSGYAAQWRREDPTSMDLLGRTRYVVVDLRNGAAKPLLDAPTGQLAGNRTPHAAFWRKDGRSIVVSNTYLPLAGVDSATRQRRVNQPAIAEINIDSGEVIPVAWEPIRSGQQIRPPRTIVGFDWDADADRLGVTYRQSAGGQVTRETYLRSGGIWEQQRARSDLPSSPFTVDQAQSLNDRPKIHVTDAGSRRSSVLFDPNPQADRLSFGRTQAIQWKDTKGTNWSAGLVLPPDYVERVRYPLVVQTHGFSPAKFLMDGPADENGAVTAFAAQALANAGFIVLQIEDNAATLTRDHLEGPAVAEGFRSGIQKLIDDGRVDASRVGLIAFSRTGWHALHLLARHPTMLAALSMSDTLNIGYSPLSYYAADPTAAAQLTSLTGGKPEIGRMDEWFASNPLYASGKSRAAIRLEAMGHGLGMWEMYGLLREANRAVEFVLYPDGAHVLQKPLERSSSQGGSVDWFRFWLQGYEDPAAEKKDQYDRWRKLRALN